MIWKPIISMPKEKRLGHWLFLCNNEKRWVRQGYYDFTIGRWYYSGDYAKVRAGAGEEDAPTHWMAIPDFP